MKWTERRAAIRAMNSREACNCCSGSMRRKVKGTCFCAPASLTSRAILGNLPSESYTRRVSWTRSVMSTLEAITFA